MKYENLWTFPPADAPNNTTENVFEIMQSQVQYLNEGMGGLVKASFNRMTAEFSGGDSECPDDANNFFHEGEYVFDIYNKRYCFRAFSVWLGSFYPIEIALDGDLMEALRDTGMETKRRIPDDYDGDYDGEFRYYIECIIIRSDVALINLLKRVFSTRKVQFMLYKLRQQSEEAEKKGA